MLIDIYHIGMNILGAVFALFGAYLSLSSARMIFNIFLKYRSMQGKVVDYGAYAVSAQGADAYRRIMQRDMITCISAIGIFLIGCAMTVFWYFQNRAWF